jgi:hypothetical protein
MNNNLINYELIEVSNEDKLKNGEVSTPYILRQEMLNLIPLSFWQVSKPIKIFEPCCGKGGFVVDIYNKLIEHSYLTKEEILMDVLYFADINEFNVMTTKRLLDPDNEYILNSYVGDTLKINIKEVFNIDAFDAVISNPPYNAVGKVNTGNTLWQHFTRKALQEQVKNNGLFLSIHPAGWRKPEIETSKSKSQGLFKLMTRDNTMLNLVIRGKKDGKNMFKCYTKYDYYLIKKKKNTNYLTAINDTNYINYSINLQEYNWLPNSNFEEVFKYFDKNINDNYEILRSSYYRIHSRTDKKIIMKEKNEEYKYPVIHSTNIVGVRYVYSNDNTKGLYGISKVIFGDTGINDVIIDMEGQYAMTGMSTGLKINSLEEGLKLKEFLLSKEFKQVLINSRWSNFSNDWRLFKFLKKLNV